MKALKTALLTALVLSLALCFALAIACGDDDDDDLVVQECVQTFSLSLPHGSKAASDGCLPELGSEWESELEVLEAIRDAFIGIYTDQDGEEKTVACDPEGGFIVPAKEVENPDEVADCITEWVFPVIVTLSADDESGGGIRISGRNPLPLDETANSMRINLKFSDGESYRFGSASFTDAGIAQWHFENDGDGQPDDVWTREF